MKGKGRLGHCARVVLEYRQHISRPGGTELGAASGRALLWQRLPPIDLARVKPAVTAARADGHCLVTSACAPAGMGHAYSLSGVVLGGPLRQLVPGDHAGLSASASRPPALGPARASAPHTNDATEIVGRSQPFASDIDPGPGPVGRNCLEPRGVMVHCRQPRQTRRHGFGSACSDSVPAFARRRRVYWGIFRRVRPGLPGLHLGCPSKSNCP